MAVTIGDALWETIEMEDRNPILFRTSPVSSTVRERERERERDKVWMTLAHRTKHELGRNHS